MTSFYFILFYFADVWLLASPRIGTSVPFDSGVVLPSPGLV